MTAIPSVGLSFDADLPPPAPPGRPMSFTGRAGDFFKLLVKGGLLQIPTFGFYRFWLVTQVRRHLWANTRIGDEAFEYTGTAKEILVGFLVALAILVPIYAAYTLLGIFAEEQQAFASVPLVLVLYVLGQFASYRARRYRATRTTFRGLRFWMDGSGWAYAGRSVLWDLLTVLTLGLAYPWRAAALERYMMRHTWYGDLQGDFVGTGGTLLRRAGWIWLLDLGIVGLVALVLYTVGKSEGPHLLVLLLLAFIPLTMPVFLAIQARWQIEGVRFGLVGVVSTLRPGAFLGTFVKLFVSMIGLVAGFTAAFVGLFALFSDRFAALQGGAFTPSLVAYFALLALGYLLLLLGMGVLQRYFLGRGLWAILAGSLSLTNLHAVDAVVAAGAPASGLGEGLADALDLGAV